MRKMLRLLVPFLLVLGGCNCWPVGSQTLPSGDTSAFDPTS